MDFPELPDVLRRPRDPKAAKAEWRETWKDHPLVRSVKIFKESKVLTDPGNIRLLADIKAREKAEEAERQRRNEESRRIGLKKRTRTLALKRALDETNAKLQQPSTDGDDDMATKKRKAKAGKKSARKAKAARSEKQVTSRLKTGTPRKADQLKKPRPERAPRGIQHTGGTYVVNAPIVPSKKLVAKMVAAGVDPSTAVIIDAEQDGKVPAQATAKPPKAESKGAKLVKILRAGPVSAAEIAEQLEWLPHTTRAAISRVGFEVTTEKKDGVTLYHIKADAKEKADAS